jgi:hypothetical protein
MMTSPYRAAREFCLQSSEILSITSPDILASCVFPIRRYLEQRFYTVEELYQWSFVDEAEEFWIH